MSRNIRQLLNSNRKKKRSQPYLTGSTSSPRKIKAAANTSPSKQQRDGHDPVEGDDGDAVGDWLNLLPTSPLRDLAPAPYFRDGTPSTIPLTLDQVYVQMFSPLLTTPGTATLPATSAKAHAYRQGLAPLLSMGYAGAVVAAGMSPAAVEREVQGLRREGIVRKIVVASRSGGGSGGRRRGGGSGVGDGDWEGLILCSKLERMVKDKVGGETGEAWVRWLRGHPLEGTVHVGGTNGGGRGGDGGVEGDTISLPQANELLRAGFLTVDYGEGILVDPDNERTSGSKTADYGTLLSLAAVGSSLTLDEAGVPGTGSNVASSLDITTAASRHGADREVLRIAVPGLGTLLKISDAAVDRLVGVLKGTVYGEAPETTLEERWNGGGGWGDKRVRSVYKTKKWKEFYGMSFEWVVGEAVGRGLVEVFETGNVGRGLRLVG